MKLSYLLKKSLAKAVSGLKEDKILGHDTNVTRETTQGFDLTLTARGTVCQGEDTTGIVNTTGINKVINILGQEALCRCSEVELDALIALFHEETGGEESETDPKTLKAWSDKQKAHKRMSTIMAAIMANKKKFLCEDRTATGAVKVDITHVSVRDAAMAQPLAAVAAALEEGQPVSG